MIFGVLLRKPWTIPPLSAPSAPAPLSAVPRPNIVVRLMYSFVVTDMCSFWSVLCVFFSLSSQ